MVMARLMLAAASTTFFLQTCQTPFCALQTPLLMSVGRFFGSLSILCWLGTFCTGGSCDTFLAGPFSCLSSLQVDIRPETFWQGLLAGQFTWPAKTVPVSCQDFWTWSWSNRDHSFQTPSVSSFDKDEALSRTNEGFYLQCTAVDNTICRVLAYF